MEAKDRCLQGWSGDPPLERERPREGVQGWLGCPRLGGYKGPRAPYALQLGQGRLSPTKLFFWPGFSKSFSLRNFFEVFFFKKGLKNERLIAKRDKTFSFFRPFLKKKTSKKFLSEKVSRTSGHDHCYKSKSPGGSFNYD